MASPPPPLWTTELIARGELEENLSEEEKRKLEKINPIEVKFFRLVQRLGRSPEDSIAVQVLYRLVLVAGRPSNQVRSERGWLSRGSWQAPIRHRRPGEPPSGSVTTPTPPRRPTPAPVLAMLIENSLGEENLVFSVSHLLPSPEEVNLTEAENEQTKHVYSVAVATAVAVEAAVMAAQPVAEVVRLTTVT
ncbi:hypothetical protein F0562_026062 [Nyssa sinensis]|uniref:Uncharacterized protein n=1 Tax=Nyssa sinensis TaxID=561372 RepID=A0A5J5BA80_9ASTE|nr:hypothetical protein F0562_026062 [Nyssa sinensis]